ncbi:hypothetical protein KZ829_18800 [Actinoplanes hulinensis]|uniref:Uncharacterized protein n=1 Tax=Actinoplanes hulinensis TaxID=1144547 RepID=A0ABS7B461_9ACTN|nr:hypothetical protein [Actinoplanes hulinensis]MBW6435795.1 hypothetical protein [Actinoplanes hulinensis]
MRRVSAELLELVPPQLDISRDLAPALLGAGPRFRLLDGAVEALDERLRPVRRRSADVGDRVRLLAAEPGLNVVVVAGQRAVTLLAGDDRYEVAIAAADSATLLPGGQVLITARDSENWAYLVGADGRILDRAGLDVAGAGVHVCAHPYDGSVLLNAGLGQDGCVVCLARVVDGALVVERLAEDVIAADFAPAGDRLLMTPHPSFDDEAAVWSWPDRAPLARLDALGDGIELYGFYLDDERVVLCDYRRGPLLCDRDLRPVAWIDLPPVPAGAAVEGPLFGLAPGVFTGDVHHDDGQCTGVWRLSA